MAARAEQGFTFANQLDRTKSSRRHRAQIELQFLLGLLNSIVVSR